MPKLSRTQQLRVQKLRRATKTSQPAFFGIDPGKKGGLAIINNGKVDLVPFAETQLEIAQQIEEALVGLLEVRAYCEIVNSGGPQQKGKKSLFSQGQNYGFIQGCLTTLRVPLEYKTPREWCAGVGFKSTGLEYNERKARLLELAQQMFPQAPWPNTKGKRLAVCDALLIAEYCRRKSV